MIQTFGFVALAGLLTIAAAPAPDDSLPTPPIPPAQGPADIAAPVPDSDARGPMTFASDEARFKLQLYRVRRPDGSVGFLPGSRYESTEDRKAIQTPGISVSVPLH
jgi:hypothetical protein